MIVVAAAVAYLLGSIPSTDWVGSLYGVDPRRDGTRNPGTANIIGLAGERAGMLVLALDAAKGVAAVVVGRLLVGDAGGLVAGVAAPAGQMFNPWYRLRGGKGLGVSLGTVTALWPWGALAGLGTVAAAVRATGSAAAGALVTFAVFVALSAVWAVAELGTAWGVTATGGLVAASAALAALLTPKFLRDVRRPA